MQILESFYLPALIVTVTPLLMRMETLEINHLFVQMEFATLVNQFHYLTAITGLRRIISEYLQAYSFKRVQKYRFYINRINNGHGYCRSNLIHSLAFI